MNWAAIDLSILGPAILAGLLVTLTHVPLGQRVLARGIIFLDLAVAQFAGLGLIAAHSLQWEPAGWQAQLIALCAAILGVLILHATEKRWPEIQEALIGIMFVLASSGGILLLASNPHGGEQLKELLVGQILWVSYQQLIPTAILYGLILALWFLLKSKSSLLFYILFALAITASVQLVGVYLVFSSLILPALAVRKCETGGIWKAYIISASGYIAGLVLAAVFDMPAGAMIVYALTVMTFLYVSLSLRHRVKLR